MVHLLAPWDDGIDYVNLFVRILLHLPASTEIGVKTSKVPCMPHIWKWPWALESFPVTAWKQTAYQSSLEAPFLSLSGEVLKTWAVLWWREGLADKKGIWFMPLVCTGISAAKSVPSPHPDQLGSPKMELCSGSPCHSAHVHHTPAICELMFP